MTNAEAISLLRGLEKSLDGYCELNEDGKKAFNRAISALEAQEWVPVSDRLPEDVEIGEEYPTVIFSTKNAVYCGFYEYYYGGNWWAAEDYIVNDVIAWKPLPEPYKENT
jgi:hypothetical protein